MTSPTSNNKVKAIIAEFRTRVYIGMTPTEFRDICDTYLDTFGVRFYSSIEIPIIAAVRTPYGPCYIKRTREFFSVGGKQRVYFRTRDGRPVSTWLPDEADALLPYIERRLVLDLLANDPILLHFKRLR